MIINLSLILKKTWIQRQFPLSSFVFIDSLAASALQEVGGYAISCQNNLELHLGCHTCWLSYFTLVCLWCGWTVGCTVTWLPNFLGWVDYHIFLPMVLRCSRFACGSSTFIHAKTTRVKNTTYTDVYCIGCVPSSFPRPKVNVSPWPSLPVPSSVLKTIYTAE